MSETSAARIGRRNAERVRVVAAADIARLASDAGVTTAALGRATGLDDSYLARVLRGAVTPSVETYSRIAAALGADLSVRLYPNTGPTIRDRHQAGILEALLATLHPRWRPFTEVAVRRPSRGWIDAALHEPRAGVVVATEIQSELRRLEQLIRWAEEKAASLPSWDGWSRVEGEPMISRLLVVRDTRATRAIAREFGRQLRVAYPGHPGDALATLTTAAGGWPGPTLLWATGRGTVASPWRLVARP